ncbi:AMP-binding protein [Psychromonas hadalis]|uniref:AMP-binding protein n=1 Tax=Psychromonas hadalis TaxID=211669 RepID=UPI0003B46008|nr:AMP-binding protein [Psychromonas hadalis]
MKKRDFNSLANLLLADRGELCVSFSADKNIKWKCFLDDIATLANHMKDKPYQTVAICCEDSYLFTVAFFASLYANKKIVLPGNHQPAMLRSLSCEFDLLIDDGVVSDKVGFESITLPLCANKSTDFTFFALDLSALSLTLFTSGSTGSPKAIYKTLLMLDAEICALEKQWGELLSDSSIVSTVSHQHIYGLLFRVLWPLCAGRAFASHDLIYPEQVIKNGGQKQTLISSPALLKRLQPEEIKTDYRAVFSSGGPLLKSAAELCKEMLNQHAIEVFGSTETGGIGFRQQIETDSAWSFFPDIKAKLADENCLSLLSPWLSEGGGDYYQTSDQCELLPNHQFRLKGRIGSIVKIEEKRISLIEVENHLNELEWIVESAVIVVDEPHRITLGALLTLTELGEQTLLTLGKGKFWIKLRQALRQWVEPVGIPRHFRLINEIPMNKQGKRLQQQIAELFK